MTHVNDVPVQDEPHTPFGGEKNSGLGRFGGEWIIEEFTSVHWISVQHTRREYPFQVFRSNRKPPGISRIRRPVIRRKGRP